jgi:hypothetical protein
VLWCEGRSSIPRPGRLSSGFLVFTMVRTGLFYANFTQKKFFRESLNPAIFFIFENISIFGPYISATKFFGFYRQNGRTAKLTIRNERISRKESFSERVIFRRFS